jgi:hypothetical protein
MAISRLRPPLDFLSEASRSSLQNFELARLNHAANLRREIGALIDQWITESAEAILARWMMENRRSPLDPPDLNPDILEVFGELTNPPSPEPRLSANTMVVAPPRFSERPVDGRGTRKTQKQRPAIGQ